MLSYLGMLLLYFERLHAKVPVGCWLLLSVTNGELQVALRGLWMETRLAELDGLTTVKQVGGIWLASHALECTCRQLQVQSRAELFRMRQ